MFIKGHSYMMSSAFIPVYNYSDLTKGRKEKIILISMLDEGIFQLLTLSGIMGGDFFLSGLINLVHKVKMNNFEEYVLLSNSW